MDLITISFNIQTPTQVEEIQIWLQENARGRYEWRYVPGTNLRKIEFELKEDAIAFALKWG
jgi:hypothetical protein